MKVTQEPQDTSNIILKAYLFLRDRDAKIVELFFLALNIYILALVILPPYSYEGWNQVIRTMIQIEVTISNFLALLTEHKRIRIVSSVSNSVIMGFISANLVRTLSPHAGTYILLTLLAIFVCWKINIKQ